MIFGGESIHPPGWVGVCISSWYMMSQCCWAPSQGMISPTPLSRERTELVEKMCLPRYVLAGILYERTSGHFWNGERQPFIMKIPTPIKATHLEIYPLQPIYPLIFPFRVRPIFNGFGLLVSGRVNSQRWSQPLCQVWFSSQTAAIFGQQEGISSLSKCSINFAVIHLSHDKKKSSWSIFGGCLHGFHPYTVKLCIGFRNF